MRFEQNDFKILILSFKNNQKGSHILIKFPLISIFFKHACLRNFPEIREPENSGSGLVNNSKRKCY